MKVGSKKLEVEWYSGKELYTHPERVKVDGVWQEVFQYEKIIREHSITRKRELVFRCHIGDNRIVEIVAEFHKCQSKTNKRTPAS